MLEKIRNRSLAISVPKRMLAAVLVITMLCGTFHATASDDNHYYVDLYDGKNLTTVYTDKTTAEEVLAEAGIVVSSIDTVDASQFVAGSDNSVITIIRPNLVGVNDEHGTVYFAFDGTVAEAIELADVSVGADDLVNYKDNEPVEDGMIISVARAFPLTIRYHGKNIAIQMAVGTVADALKKAGVTLGKNDVVSHKTDDVVSSGMVVFVDEIIYKNRTETKSIPFSSYTKKDSTMTKGTSKITTKGVNGQNELTYKEKYVNGVLIDTTLVSEKVLKKPVAQVTSVGTKKIYDVKAKGVPYSKLGTVAVDKNGVPKNYTKVFSGSATAYTGGVSTSTGRKPGVGYVAVDPQEIPYGTKLYIVATDGTVYGYCIAADTGGFIYNSNTLVDVYMASKSDCIQWGRKNVNVYVLG
ncbi:MAG TPA: hypothetical protein DDY98_07195 [Ruminococcaceae bacterium]|nr:hypothetical protein [Oscillospiraceae bacterium]